MSVSTSLSIDEACGKRDLKEEKDTTISVPVYRCSKSHR